MVAEAPGAKAPASGLKESTERGSALLLPPNR